MRKNEFIAEFAEIVDVAPDELKPETELETLEMWDSVAYLSAMVLIDEELGITIRPEVLSRAKTFEDILKAVDSALQE